jgi:phytoene desaturase
MKKAIVIGGGVAGLAAAAGLAPKGWEVDILEKQPRLGGAFRSIRLGPYLFDLGPSNVTMPWMFERIFREAGRFMDPSLRFIPLPVSGRHFFHDGTWMDLSADPEYMGQQLGKLSPEDRQGFLDYVEEVRRMYEAVEEHFLERPAGDLTEFLSLESIKAWWSVHPFESVDSFHRRFFDDPRILAMLNRYAASVGSSPFEAPAAVSLISYLEMVQGTCYVEGGNDRLIEALRGLVGSLGVKIHLDCQVEELVVQSGRVTGVRAGGQVWEADAVLLASDPGDEHPFLPPETAGSIPASPRTSAFVCLLGLNRRFSHLHHHNLFYHEDAGREYIDLFEQREWSRSPVIYVGNPAFSEPDRAPEGGSALCVMVHVPAAEREEEMDWQKKYKEHREWLVHLLETKWGFAGLSGAIEEEMILGPRELEEMTGAPGGSLYGPAAHGLRTFFRLPARNRKVAGLYHAGPAVCPGGVSLSAVSGLHAAEIMSQDVEEGKQQRAGV